MFPLARRSHERSRRGAPPTAHARPSLPAGPVAYSSWHLVKSFLNAELGERSTCSETDRYHPQIATRRVREICPGSVAEPGSTSPMGSHTEIIRSGARHCRLMEPALLELIVSRTTRAGFGDGAALDVADLQKEDLVCPHGHGYLIRDGVPRLVPGDRPARDRPGRSTRLGQVVARRRSEGVQRSKLNTARTSSASGRDQEGYPASSRKRHCSRPAAGLGPDAARFARLEGAGVAIDLSEHRHRQPKGRRRRTTCTTFRRTPAPALCPTALRLRSRPTRSSTTRPTRLRRCSLASLLRPAGTLAFYVYKRKADAGGANNSCGSTQGRCSSTTAWISAPR